jgi:hypothetical protein
MIEDVRIDAELKSLLPALTDDEQRHLREAVARDGGFTDPIVVWLETGFLVDGYNRFEIWQTVLNRDFSKTPKIVALSFPSKGAVKAWMLHRQSARRNMNESQRAICAAQLAKAKSAVAMEQGQICPSQKESATELNVSARSVKTANKVINEGAASLVKAVTDGKVSVSDASKIVDLPKRTQAIAVKSVASGKSTTVAKAVQDCLLNPESIDEAIDRLMRVSSAAVESASAVREAMENRSKLRDGFDNRIAGYRKNHMDGLDVQVSALFECCSELRAAWLATKHGMSSADCPRPVETLKRA